MFAIIRRVIDQEARLAVPAADLTPGADLYKLGLTPYSAVRILLALEREFEVELPRGLLKRETMQSIDAVARALHIAMSANGARSAA
ncbi:acyl carrier protein [Methylocystis parvus]|uniref:Acyl carrier protein n=1 Tax=Methylocystis parvus TaxID=134 RepID=A0A6B8M1K4_9HYPH|nr:acyl carrier protein [Methylocystis parvus]QGM96136.1 acyl carrier protein [Methylocystis parvus]WBK00042.1 acyl carrier protein [Methylocystis parvus OBBP]